MRKLSIFLVGIIAIALAALLFSGCYTEKNAIKKFGCRTDSNHVDSNTRHWIDTFYQKVFIPADTVVINGPCEEIKNMQPGQSKTVKGKRTTGTYGKDSTGKSFFKCEADAYKDSMEWYRENWHTTVINTIFKHQPVPEFSWWQWIKEGWPVLMILLVVLILVMIFKR